MSPDAARADRELQMLEALVDCAHELALAVGAAAQAERDRGAQLRLLDAFQRSFQAVRLGIRLSMTLRAGPKSAQAPARPPANATSLRPERLDADRLDAESLEVERAEPLEAEAPEREREYEAVSLPRFLATLGVVAAEAGALAQHLPGGVAARTLPTLHDLLRQAQPSRPAPAAPRPSPGALAAPRPDRPKAALLGSASAPRPWRRRG